MLLDHTSGLMLVDLLLKLSHFSLLEQLLKVLLLLPTSVEEGKLLNNLVSSLHNLEVQLGDDWVDHDIFIESKWNVLVLGLLMSSFLEDLAETVPPSSELLSGL